MRAAVLALVPACWLFEGGPDPCGRAAPEMVRVAGYCIDSTEVTNDQYAAFVAARVPVATQPAVCAWNTTFARDPACTVGLDGALPVACVDWCDAYAYCAWAGKRLCGAIGGGPVDASLAVDPSADQWMRACAGGGDMTFPYGASYRAGVCNVPGFSGDPDSDHWGPVAAGSLAGCSGTTSGVFDLVGNVYEWEDACIGTSGARDACAPRGGAFLMCTGTGGAGCTAMTQVDPATVGCAFALTGVPRMLATPNFGFRCCADVRD
jgi:formylglycine-generating enzyme required for sulfatase activity